MGIVSAPNFADGDTVAASVIEDAAAGTAVYNFAEANFSTPDGVGGDVTYALEVVGDHTEFTFDAATRTLRVIAPPQERANPYQITISATSGNVVISQTLTLTVTDDDADAPEFSSAATAMVAEGSAASFYTAVAVADVAASGVTYGLSGGGDYAEINAESGEVTLKSGFDFDKLAGDGFDITITATDNTDPARISTQLVTVTVMDINDEAPVAKVNAVNIDGEQADTAIVITIAHFGITDADKMAADPSLVIITVTKAAIGATLSKGEKPLNTADSFTLADLNNGLIKLTITDALNYKNFKFTVFDGVKTSDEQSFDLSINDKVDYSSKDPTQSYVIDTGDGIDTIIGSDGDDIIDGGKGLDKITPGVGADTIVYEFGSDSSGFSGHDGTTVVKGFNRGVDKLRFVTQDNSGDYATVEKFWATSLLADKPMFLPQVLYHFEENEDTDGDVVVVKGVTFTFRKSGVFSGERIARGFFGIEFAEDEWMTDVDFIAAIGGIQNYDSSLKTITSLNGLEAYLGGAGSIEYKVASFSLTTITDALVEGVFADGADIATIKVFNGNGLTFSVDNDLFEIVGQALRLKDGAMLDSADGSSITATVTASKDDSIDLTRTFTLTIIDANVFVPTSISLAASASTIDEADGVSEQILTEVVLHGSDTQGYSFAVNDARFDVIGGNLIIIAGSNFDYEAEGGVITVTITMTKDGATTLTATYTLTLNDVNDLPPIFAPTRPPPAVVENVEISADTAVYTAAATGNAGAVVGYSLEGADSDLFNIDGETGVVTFKTTTTPDYEPPNAEIGLSYSFTVRATAGDQTATQHVVITVVDVFDAMIMGDLSGDVMAGANSENTVSGRILITEVLDPNTIVTPPASLIGVYGSIVFNGNAWVYTLDNSLETTQMITEGDVATERFTVGLGSLSQGQISQDIVITVDSVNIDPTASIDVGDDRERKGENSTSPGNSNKEKIIRIDNPDGNSNNVVGADGLVIHVGAKAIVAALTEDQANDYYDTALSDENLHSSFDELTRLSFTESFGDDNDPVAYYNGVYGQFRFWMSTEGVLEWAFTTFRIRPEATGLMPTEEQIIRGNSVSEGEFAYDVITIVIDDQHSGYSEEIRIVGRIDGRNDAPEIVAGITAGTAISGAADVVVDGASFKVSDPDSDGDVVAPILSNFHVDNPNFEVYLVSAAARFEDYIYGVKLVDGVILAEGVYELKVRYNDGVSSSPFSIDFTVSASPTVIALSTNTSTLAEADNVIIAPLAEVTLAGDDAANSNSYIYLADDARFEITGSAPTGSVTGRYLRIIDGSNFDFETEGDTIVVTITATKGDKLLTATYSLTLTDVNDEAPRFTAILEIDALVENIAISDSTTIYKTIAIGNAGAMVSYSLEGADADLFNVDGDGRVTFKTATTPDFESKTSYDFTVRATASDNTPTPSAIQTAIQDISIAVIDVNDQPPVFSSSGVGLRLQENIAVAVDTAVYTAAATGNAGAVITYSLEGTDAVLFNIDGDGVVTFADITTPDFESKSNYDLRVRATAVVEGSASSEIQAAVQDITITITDMNDQPPVFTSVRAGLQLQENIAVLPNTAVYTAAAVGNAGVAVRYSLEGADRGLFNIDGATGVVTFKTATTPDFETKSSYDFRVRATADDQAATQNISIIVMDVNDEAPIFTSASGDLLIENVEIPLNTAVYTAAAVGNGGVAVRYSLEGADSDLFNIDGATGVVTFKAAITPDFDTKSSYAFTVRAVAGGQVATKDVVITVAEGYSAAMIIGDLDGDVAIDASDGTAIGDATGTVAIINFPNPDITITPPTVLDGIYGTIAFTGNSWVYSLNSDLAATQAITRDAAVVDRFTVTAGPISEDIEISISIFNADPTASVEPGSDGERKGENSTVFPKDGKTITIDDVDGDSNNVVGDNALVINVGVKAVVVALADDQARDYFDTALSDENLQSSLDELTALTFTESFGEDNEPVAYYNGVYGQFRFWMSTEGDLKWVFSPFRILPSNTDLVPTEEQVDRSNSLREGEFSYDVVTIVVSDQYGGHSTPIRIVARVNGRNDKPEIIAEAATGTARSGIDGAVVDGVAFKVSDLDDNDDPDTSPTLSRFIVKNADETDTSTAIFKPYIIFAGDSFKDFTYGLKLIDGVILDGGTHRLIITYNDGVSVSADSETFTVIASSTVITLSANASRITEADNLAEAVLATLTLVGDDAAASDTYRYSVDDVRFSITSASSGGLLLGIVGGSSFDQELDGDTVNVTITATKDARSLTTTYSLSLTDINDAPPTFAPIAANDALIENVEIDVDTVVYTALALGDAQAAVVYSLEGADSDLFNINSDGTVRFINPITPNFEDKPHYDLMIRATAGGQSAAHAVRIEVTDVNDLPPVFRTGAIIAKLVENIDIDVNTVIYIAAAVGNAGAVVRYTLEGADSDLLNIDDDGRVTFKTATTPDFETKSSYDFTVRATAGVEGEQSAISDVTIGVADVNDAPPTFAPKQVVNPLIENVEIDVNTAVYTAMAVGNAGAVVKYTLEGVDAYLFNIDASTGVITFKAATTPDFEAKASYNLMVWATADGQIAIEDITIGVSDANDLPPVFAANSAPTVLVERVEIPLNAAVYTATAVGNAGAVITYSLEGADAELFNIDGDGRVTFKVATTPDFKTKPRYAFTVKATADDQVATEHITIRVADGFASTMIIGDLDGDVAIDAPDGGVTTVSGRVVVINSPDPDIIVTPPTVLDGTYGTIVFDGNMWTYTLNSEKAETQAITRDNIGVETFTVTAGPVSQDIIITIAIYNVAPTASLEDGADRESKGENSTTFSKNDRTITIADLDGDSNNVVGAAMLVINVNAKAIVVEGANNQAADAYFDTALSDESLHSSLDELTALTFTESFGESNAPVAYYNGVYGQFRFWMSNEGDLKWVFSPFRILPSSTDLVPTKEQVDRSNSLREGEFSYDVVTIVVSDQYGGHSTPIHIAARVNGRNDNPEIIIDSRAGTAISGVDGGAVDGIAFHVSDVDDNGDAIAPILSNFDIDNANFEVYLITAGTHFEDYTYGVAVRDGTALVEGKHDFTVTYNDGISISPDSAAFTVVASSLPPPPPPPIPDLTPPLFDVPTLSIDGGAAADVLTGTAAEEIIQGGAGGDTITAAGGGDVIIGGYGADVINLGTGGDTVIYRFDSTGGGAFKSSDGGDTINNFRYGVDRLILIDESTGGNPIDSFAEFIADNGKPSVIVANDSNGIIQVEMNFGVAGDHGGGQTLTINFDHTETVASYDSSIFLAGVILRDFTFLDDFFGGLSAFTIASQADLPSGVDII